MFNNKSILVTGGTGSFGKSFVEYILNNFKPKKLIIFSRDELKQYDMLNSFIKHKNFNKLRFLLGDVRDRERLNLAFKNVDFVIHAAALKQIPAAEYNPQEVIKTNINGAQNIVESCLDSNVKKVIALSTDKAVAPLNLYGATKLCSDKLFISANNILGKRDLSFSVVRYGNVMGSRGSVIPLFLEQKKSGTIKITDSRMTRFNISMEDSIKMVLWSLKNSIGGEVFVPKIPSYNIVDLAKAVAPDCKIKYIGLRPGEKLHEELISTGESYNTIDLQKYYAILNYGEELERRYLKNKKFKKVKNEFSYSSGNNIDFLSVSKLIGLMQKSKLI
jgi:UDP-N-acetylglucosamine 4,6-dehydratase (inverting)